jgi:hypothetical protein
MEKSEFNFNEKLNNFIELIEFIGFINNGERYEINITECIRYYINIPIINIDTIIRISENIKKENIFDIKLTKYNFILRKKKIVKLLNEL